MQPIVLLVYINLWFGFNFRQVKKNNLHYSFAQLKKMQFSGLELKN